jgi:hypothetical protein
MKRMKLFMVLVLLVLILTACAQKAVTSNAASGYTTTNKTQVEPTINPGMGGTMMSTSVPGSANSDGLARSDDQGNVVIDLTPESLTPSGDSFVFDVKMNTHMVNLDMDLAQLSTLGTDDGRSVQATNWDAPAGGGHHVTGKLLFPAKRDGKSLLEGAKRLTVTIKKVDADTRLFTWQLSN